MSPKQGLITTLKVSQPSCNESNRNSVRYIYAITMRQCQKSILMPKYAFLASSRDFANMDCVNLGIITACSQDFYYVIFRWYVINDVT